MINDVELWNQVTPELQSGEKLLWVGKPLPIRVMLANGEVITTLFSFAILVFGIVMFSQFTSSAFGNFSTIRSPISMFSWFPIFFGVFALVLLARPVYAFFMATRTIYGLTDRRAIIISHGFSGKKVESYTETDQIERTDIANGKGDLVFDRAHTRYRRKGGYRVRTRKIGFFGIENVRDVEGMMLRSLKEKEAAF